MQEFIRFFFLLFCIAWFIYECYSVIKICKFDDVILLSCEVEKIEKNRNYNTASLHIKVRDNSDKFIDIRRSFFSNVRWWFQKIPSVGDKVFFYIKKKRYTDKISSSPTDAFGINVQSSSSKFKLFADLFYDFTVSKSIIFFAIVTILLIIQYKFFSDSGIIMKFVYLYWLIRLFLQSIFLKFY